MAELRLQKVEKSNHEVTYVLQNDKKPTEWLITDSVVNLNDHC